MSEDKQKKIEELEIAKKEEPKTKDSPESEAQAEDQPPKKDTQPSEEAKIEKKSASFPKGLIIAGIIGVILILGGLVYVLATNWLPASVESQPKIVDTDQGKQISFKTLEIADENKERLRGFMFREEICDSCGMLFVFPQEQFMSFWMKDTPVSLDMIFIDQSGEVVKIHTNAEPKNIDKRYSSDYPAKYVLETKAGFVEKFGLQEGDKIDIDHLRNQGTDFVFIKPE